MKSFPPLLAPLLLLLIIACQKEELRPEDTLQVNDLTVTIDENPVAGQSLGTVQTVGVSNNPVFILSGQSSQGAMVIDGQTGAISVNDESLFDFETNPALSANVRVTDGNASGTAAILVTLKDVVPANDPTPKDDYHQRVISYFKDIALGFEFGGASRITRRWATNMKIFVGGMGSTELRAELDSIIHELNTLATTVFAIEMVNDSIESNFYIFFGSGSQYAERFPSQANLVASNFGLFSIFWNGSQEMIRGHMYVDIFRANETEQKHLLREELTQSLGLGRDSGLYAESIFQQSFSTKTTSYALIDKDLIRLLYHPEMSVGLNDTEVGPVLQLILDSE